MFRRLAGDGAALWGAAGFAVLPGHSEAVIAIAGRADLLTTAGSLAALLIWSGRWSPGAGGFCFGIALLSKEQAAVVPGLLLCLCWLQHRCAARRWCWTPFGVSGLVLAAYLLLRHTVLGGQR